MRLLICALLMLSGTMAAANPGIPADEQLIADMAPGPPPPANEVDQRAQDIASRLRCPVCQGLSVAGSTAEAALIMQRRIRELVAAGYSEEDIRDFFVSKYGEWVLLDPPREGLNWVIWLGPILMLGGGLLTVILVTKMSDEPSSSPHESINNRWEAGLLAEVDDE